MKCSVVVPTYNRRRLLGYTLDSLVRQRLPKTDFEVIVIDDGSSDGTDELVAGYRERLNVRYFFQEDRGYRLSKARNVGVHNARGDICVFLDSGVLLHSGGLAAHLASHAARPEPLGVCGYVYCFNEDNEDGEVIARSIDYDDPDTSIAKFAAQDMWPDIREEFYQKYGDDFGHLPAPWLMFWGVNSSARTEQIRRVGGFDEAYQSWGVEDVDLGYRLHQDGAHFLVDRRATAIHCPHPKSYEENMRSAAGNYRYFAAKYGTPIAQLVIGNHFHVINDIIRERGLA